jgi:hypothetical protein
MPLTTPISIYITGLPVNETYTIWNAKSGKAIISIDGIQQLVVDGISTGLMWLNQPANPEGTINVLKVANNASENMSDDSNKAVLLSNNQLLTFEYFDPEEEYEITDQNKYWLTQKDGSDMASFEVRELEPGSGKTDKKQRWKFRRATSMTWHNPESPEVDPDTETK